VLSQSSRPFPKVRPSLRVHSTPFNGLPLPAYLNKCDGFFRGLCVTHSPHSPMKVPPYGFIPLLLSTPRLLRIAKAVRVFFPQGLDNPSSRSVNVPLLLSECLHLDGQSYDAADILPGSRPLLRCILLFDVFRKRSVLMPPEIYPGCQTGHEGFICSTVPLLRLISPLPAVRARWPTLARYYHGFLVARANTLRASFPLAGSSVSSTVGCKYLAYSLFITPTTRPRLHSLLAPLFWFLQSLFIRRKLIPT